MQRQTFLKYNLGLYGMFDGFENTCGICPEGTTTNYTGAIGVTSCIITTVIQTKYTLKTNIHFYDY